MPHPELPPEWARRGVPAQRQTAPGSHSYSACGSGGGGSSGHGLS